jgi:hypothetical protein
MRRNGTTISLVGCLLLAAGGLSAMQGCGDSSSSVFDGNNDGTDDGTNNGSADGGGTLNGNNVFGADAGLVEGGPHACVNLECKQVSCPAGGKTTVTGTVYDPAGTNPLYNAIVYVPNGKVEPFTAGVSCDKCGALASGSPLVSALSGADGKFTLENVPVGSDIPLVIQIGRWRRQVTIPAVSACAETKLTDAGMTRLPRNKSEGDIPQMAISTGGSDPFECLLVKMGIDTAEFTPKSGDGRVHFYHENGRDMNPAAPAAKELWSDVATLKKYDIVFLPCEGSATNKNDPDDHAAPARKNLEDYTAVGGRVFTTHYSYAWAQPIWPSVGGWDVNQTYLSDPTPNDDGLPDTVTGTLDTSFPKGKAFADWLQNVATDKTYGKLAIHEARHDINTVNNPPAQRWISMDNAVGGNSPNSIQHMTFNTPVAAAEPQQCGKVVYSDFHVSASALDTSVTKYFPGVCKKGALTDQEKALEFMIFDLSSCIQKDDKPPAPPPPPPVR